MVITLLQHIAEMPTAAVQTVITIFLLMF